jgi:ligand-binding SRPBCC domain-containing protein
MKSFIQEQFLPIDIQTAWAFFSRPENLNEITPPQMEFKILPPVQQSMYAGMMIPYQIKPMLGITMQWLTEITQVNEPNYFVDEQRSGPYALWHHEHHFQSVPGGILMTDKLYYNIGKSIFGWIAGKLFVHRAISTIFEYRKTRIEELIRTGKL